MTQNAPLILYMSKAWWCPNARNPIDLGSVILSNRRYSTNRKWVISQCLLMNSCRKPNAVQHNHVLSVVMHSSIHPYSFHRSSKPGVADVIAYEVHRQDISGYAARHFQQRYRETHLPQRRTQTLCSLLKVVLSFSENLLN